MKKGIIILLLIMVLAYIFIRPTVAEILDYGVEVKENTELIYYLDVTYDGVDENGVESTGSNLLDIYSEYIYVEDKLPEGLTFTGFKTAEDGSIGAVSKNDPNIPCLGYVVNGKDGLKYDDTTRTVSFTVKNLQAGCKLTVGIKTMTPTIDDPTTNETELRRDFYNTATVTEKEQTEYSNTEYVWMGSETVKLYPVTYKFKEGSPANVPILPPISSYSENAVVGLEKAPILEGYKFDGWETTDVIVADGKYTMPNKSVTFEGSFTELPKHQVSYKINGESPEGYILPTTKEYHENTTVNLDILKVGDIVNGYKFLGWTVPDGVVLEDGKKFKMPGKNVEFVGNFEEVTYKVEYRFQGSVLPPNYQNLLPKTKEYTAGTTVKLENDLVASDYRFLGWYAEKEFEMPKENVVIYGEWAENNNLFNLKITKNLSSNKEFFLKGEQVKYDIVIKNENNFPVTNVVIQEKNEKAFFVADSAYTLDSNHLVTIPKIDANKSVTVKAIYTVGDEDKGTISNTVEILGAEVEGKVLNPSNENKATETFNVKIAVKVCKKVENKETKEVFRIRIWNDNFETFVLLKDDQCKTIYLANGKYNIQEILPKEYKLTINGPTTSNGGNFIIESGNSYNFEFVSTYEKIGFFQTFGRLVGKIEAIK